MQNLATEKLLSKILAYGAALTTVFVLTGSGTDPVNTPKLLIIGVMAAGALGLISTSKLGSRITTNWKTLIPTFFFVAAMSLSVIASKSPLSQNLYGSYGRNNGLFAYLFLAIILCSALALRESSGFTLLVKAFFFAGLVNVAYCLWVVNFGDFIGWYNPYGNILGTLGNPDFIGAFLGMFFAAYLAYGLGKESGKLFKYSMILVLPITAFEIIDSHAIQGRVIAVLGTGIVAFFYLRLKFSSFVVAAYAAFSVIVGALAVGGALQIGPLTKYIYKTSVSLRGQYWLAAWNAGESHPVSGIGMDAFGDWYRRSRSPRAIELPGVNTVVNAAHNVWLDMFAFGGWPLLLSYLAILTLAAVAIVKVIIRKKEYNATFVALTTAWIGYQAQSVISINQIGLAIWGWVLSGAIIAFEVSTRESAQTSTDSSGRKSGRSNQNSQESLRVMVATFSGIVGLLLALPPLTADVKWRSAQLAQTAPGIEATMQPSFFNPQNSSKYLSNIQTLEASSLFDLSHKYALEAVKWNPESFELWKLLYLVKNSTSEERAQALKNMKRLDPLNPDVTSIK
jgi:hypothetical protein